MKLANAGKPDTEKSHRNGNAVALLLPNRRNFASRKVCSEIDIHCIEALQSRHRVTDNVAIMGSGTVATRGGPDTVRDLIHVTVNSQVRRTIVFFAKNIHKFHQSIAKHNSENDSGSARRQEVQGGPIVMLAQTNSRSMSLPVLVARVTSSTQP